MTDQPTRTCTVSRDVLNAIVEERNRLRHQVAELTDEIEHLRGLLARALREWHNDAALARCTCHALTCECVFDDIEQTRREAGLT